MELLELSRVTENSDAVIEQSPSLKLLLAILANGNPAPGESSKQTVVQPDIKEC